MSVYAELADGRRLEFPDGTDPSVVQATVKKMLGGTEPAKPAAKQNDSLPDNFSYLQNIQAALAEPLMAMGSGLAGKVASDVAGLGATGVNAAHNFTTGRSDAGMVDAAALKDKIQRAITYQPRTEGGKAVNEYNPLALLAKGFDWGGGKLEDKINEGSNSPALSSAIGQGVHEAVNQAPGLLGFLGGKAGNAASGWSKGKAETWMQKALKPTLEDQQSGVAQKAGRYLLDEGLNVTPGGVEKMMGTRDALDAQLTDVIKNSTKSIDRDAVGARLGPVLDKAKLQALPGADMSTIKSAWDEFLNSHPATMPVQYAQDVKRGTYKSIGDKAYNGELGSTSVQSQQAIARGLKEDIAAAEPAAGPINAELSKVINTLEPTERAVLMHLKQNPGGISLIASSKEMIAALLLGRSPLFKSIVARMLNSPVAGGLSALGDTAPATGAIVSQGAGLLGGPPDQRGLLGP